MPEGGRRGGVDAAKNRFSASRPLEQPGITVRGVAEAGRHGIEQRSDGAAHRQHAGDDEDGDQGHDQRVFDGVGAALVTKKRNDVILKNPQHG